MSREPALVTVKVSTGTQLSFGGTTYVSGAEVHAPEHIAERWIVRGWAEPASKPTGDVGKAPTRSRRTR